MPIIGEITGRTWHEVDGLPFGGPKRHLTVFEVEPPIDLDWSVLDVVQQRAGTFAVSRLSANPETNRALYGVTTEAMGDALDRDEDAIDSARALLKSALAATTSPFRMLEFMVGEAPQPVVGEPLT